MKKSIGQDGIGKDQITAASSSRTCHRRRKPDVACYQKRRLTPVLTDCTNKTLLFLSLVMVLAALTSIMMAVALLTIQPGTGVLRHAVQRHFSGVLCDKAVAVLHNILSELCYFMNNVCGLIVGNSTLAIVSIISCVTFLLFGFQMLLYIFLPLLVLNSAGYGLLAWQVSYINYDYFTNTLKLCIQRSLRSEECSVCYPRRRRSSRSQWLPMADCSTSDMVMLLFSTMQCCGSLDASDLLNLGPGGPDTLPPLCCNSSTPSLNLTGASIDLAAKTLQSICTLEHSYDGCNVYFSPYRNLVGFVGFVLLVLTISLSIVYLLVFVIFFGQTALYFTK